MFAGEQQLFAEVQSVVAAIVVVELVMIAVD